MLSLWDRRQQEAGAELKRLVAARGAEPTEKREEPRFRKSPAVKPTMSEGKLKTQAGGARPSRHPKLLAWVDEVAALCQPANITWCDGSPEEYRELCGRMVASGTLIRLNPEKRPNSFLARSDPRDVARMDDRTFICSPGKDQAGATNNCVNPREMKARLQSQFSGQLRGRRK